MSTAVVHVARNPDGGVWSVIKTLARAQSQAGYYVRLGLILTDEWPHRPELEAVGVPTWTCTSPRLCNTAAFLLHSRLLNPLKPWLNRLNTESGRRNVVVHYHDAWLSGALAVRAKDYTQTRQVVTFHGPGGLHRLKSQPVRLWQHRRWARAVVREGCSLVSVDGPSISEFQDSLGIRADAFSIVPNGVEFVVQCTLPARTSGRLRVAHVGTINKGKGWHLTAEAVRQLFEAGVPIELLIAGSGPEEQNAREWCDQNRGFASFLGYVANAGATIMPGVDVLSLPTDNDGLPMVVLEAMAHGVVVVATPIGGIPGVLRDGITGFLAARSAPVLATTFKRLAEDRALLREMQEASARRYRECYSATAMCRAYSAVYECSGKQLSALPEPQFTEQSRTGL